jgi:transketolase
MKTYQKMTLLAAFLGLITIIPFASTAQDESHGKPMGEKREKIRSHKIAFITERLQLTPAEAEKFWPIYNEHEAAMTTFHKEFRKNHPFEPEDIEAMPDAEANAFIEEQMKHEQQAFELRKEFIGKLKGVIPSKKILMLMEAEKDFRVEVVRKVAGKDGPPLPYENIAKPEQK